jgi:hypothetical protein
MALDDRDRTFEKALARQLRSSASSTPDANALAGASASPLAGLCPDPETLAAYHDGSLSLEERNLWKNHVLSCDSCQLVLAHLATPLEIPVGQDVKEDVLVAQQRATSAAAPSVPGVRPSPIHSLRWLWLVPAGAIAAALVAWVSLQEKKSFSVTPSSPVEIAENRQPAGTAPPEKPALADSRERKRKDQSAASSTGGVAEADLASRDSALKKSNSNNESQQNQQNTSQNAPAPTHGPSLSQQKQEQQINRIAAGRAGAADQKKLDATSGLNANGRSAGAAAGSALASPAPVPPPPTPPSSEPGFVAGGSIPPPPPAKAVPAQHAPVPSSASGGAAGAAPKPEAAAADSISAASESVDVSSAPQAFAKTKAKELGMMRSAALQNPRVFGAPDGKQLWRIGPAGSLEHSKDTGLNWIQQISGVYTDLLAGSAPSAKVCWIVGNAGTILRTTDGGTHWTKLDSPVTNDLTGVRAEDAKHAWIWFVPDPQTGFVKTYQTSDGGRTWSTLSGE